MKNYQFISVLVLILVSSLFIHHTTMNKLSTVQAAVILAQPKPEKVSLVAVEEKLAQVDSKLEDLKKSNESLHETQHETQMVLGETLNKNTEKLNALTPVTVTKYKYVVRKNSKKYRKHRTNKVCVAK